MCKGTTCIHYTCNASEFHSSTYHAASRIVFIQVILEMYECQVQYYVMLLCYCEVHALANMRMHLSIIWWVYNVDDILLTLLWLFSPPNTSSTLNLHFSFLCLKRILNKAKCTSKTAAPLHVIVDTVCIYPRQQVYIYVVSYQTTCTQCV